MLSDEAQEKISVDQFAQMQDKRVAAQEMKMKTEEAVKNNDFAAFVAVVEEMRAAKKAMKDDHAGENNDREGHEFSDEKLQKKFEKLTTYYVENGTLPEMKGKGKGGVRMKKFARGKLKSSHKGLVMKAITNSSSDTLERVLEVIEKRVEKMESSDMGEEKKMSVIEMLEGIAQVIVEQLDGDLEDGEFESLLEEVLS